jgi:hypothetical protein
MKWEKSIATRPTTTNAMSLTTTTDRGTTTHLVTPANRTQLMILNRNSLQVTSNIPRFGRETIQHNLTNDPRQTGPTGELLRFPRHYYGRLRVAYFTTTRTPTRGTTIPMEPTVYNETLQKFSCILFGNLLETIPEECAALREVLDSYASEQDGYSALY